VSGPEYSTELCRELCRRADDPRLKIRYRPERYEAGDVLELALTTVWPETQGHGRFLIEKFVGGGFAGQVYRCRVLALDIPRDEARLNLRENDICAVKIMIPPTRLARVFRDSIYWLGFQGPFSAQVNRAACRAGLLWQKLVRTVARVEMGDECAVADVFASFYDPVLRSYGEVREWVEGRTWLLEPDARIWRRWKWKTLSLDETDSREYVAKRRFMRRMVAILHELGAPELARQYEWWTMKSQPNVLKRKGTTGPEAGLCAVDFRAGLALLPFLPMSPADVALIVAGLRRGSPVQFDRCDCAKLGIFAIAHRKELPELEAMAGKLKDYDCQYRRSLPDVTHQGWRLLIDKSLRENVRRGLIEGYLTSGYIDECFAATLAASPARFALFYLVGAAPLVGRFIRRLWGHAAFRMHIFTLLGDASYFRIAARASVAACLVRWLHSGRVSDKRARFLMDHPALFWFQRIALGCLPSKIHKVIAEPGWCWGRIEERIRFVVRFWRDPAFREEWLTSLVVRGFEQGMLSEQERDTILRQVGDRFVAVYLKSVAVHFATLPVTQIVSVTVGGLWAGSILLTGGTWASASAAFVGTLALFQFMPISPGSLCRGFYTLFLVIRDKSLREYMVAAPLSFLKYIGYLAFPIQMATTYPALSRLMASEWATSAVRIVPVFGEKGALLEHWVFDLFFNVPCSLGRLAAKRMGEVLTLWMLLGTSVLCSLHWGTDLRWTSRSGINLLLVIAAVFFLPRIVFYPILRRKGSDNDQRTPDNP